MLCESKTSRESRIELLRGSVRRHRRVVLPRAMNSRSAAIAPTGYQSNGRFLTCRSDAGALAIFLGFGVKELDKAIKVKVHEAETSFFRSHGLPRATRFLMQAYLGPLHLGHVRVECLGRHFPSRIPASLSRRRTAGLPSDWRPRVSVQAISSCRFLGPGRPGQRIAVIRSRCGARPGDAAFVSLATVTATSPTVHAVQGTSSCSSVAASGIPNGSASVYAGKTL